MKTKQNISGKILFVTGLMMLLGILQPVYSGVPVTGLLICCRGADIRQLSQQWLNPDNINTLNNLAKDWLSDQEL